MSTLFPYTTLFRSSSSIDLTHEDKSISIEFAALHFVNPAGNQYAYMLEGFDQDWIYVDAHKRVASYSNLEPGEYTFKVKDRKSTRLNSSHVKISYAVFCLKKKNS